MKPLAQDLVDLIDREILQPENQEKFDRLMAHLDPPEKKLNFRMMGRFTINENFIREQPGMVMEVLAKMLVVGCSSDFAARTLNYTALCADFREVEEGRDIPTYNIITTMTKLEDGFRTDIKFEEWKK